MDTGSHNGVFGAAVRKNGARRGIRRSLVLAMLAAAFFIGLFLVRIIVDTFGFEEAPVKLGATFSKPYAESLGLDWQEAYLATLDDLHVTTLRIPAYWDDIEPAEDEYDFTNVDWQLDEAAKRGVRVILAVGRKLPRWPECRVPEWSAGMSEDDVQERILAMIETTVKRYVDRDNVVAWQVENEPFFPFGECPEPDRRFLQREISMVHAHDRRPVMITESGELSTWVNAASLADILGISTYRIVWDKVIGYVFWPVTPRYYIQRINAVRPFVDTVIVSELQAEPWVTTDATTMSLEEQLRIMNPTRLRDNVTFVRRIGVAEAYVWGVEWWYWLKEKKNRPEMWEEGKRLFGASVAPGSLQ